MSNRKGTPCASTAGVIVQPDTEKRIAANAAEVLLARRPRRWPTGAALGVGEYGRRADGTECAQRAEVAFLRAARMACSHSSSVVALSWVGFIRSRDRDAAAAALVAADALDM